MLLPFALAIAQIYSCKKVFCGQITPVFFCLLTTADICLINIQIPVKLGFFSTRHLIGPCFFYYIVYHAELWNMALWGN